LCSSRKYPYSPHRRDWIFLGVGEGSLRPKNLKKCVKFNWNFQTVGGGRGSFRGRYEYYFVELHIFDMCVILLENG